MTPEDRFEVFFKENYAMLCRGVYRLLKDESVSEDLVQEVFLKVWEKRDKLDLNDRFIFYLKKACYHEALQHLKTNHITTDNFQATMQILGDERTDEALLKSELEKKVITGINLLPDKSKLVFSLSRYEEMTYREIAEQLEISTKAVEKHMTKALKHLRDYLSEFLTILVFFIFS